MTYDPTRLGGVTPIERIEPFTAVWVGDSGSAGGTGNVQQFMNTRRGFRGELADTTARNGLTGLADGHWCWVLGDPASEPELHIYRTLPSPGWRVFTPSGGGGGGGTTTIHGLYEIVGYGDGVETDFAIPGNGFFERVQVGGVPQYNGTDYDVVTVEGTRTVRFRAGKIPPLASDGTATLPVAISAAETYDPDGTGGGSHGPWAHMGWGDGTKTDFPLPGTGLDEQVFKGGAPMIPGLHYDVVSVGGVRHARFRSGYIPLGPDPYITGDPGERVMGSCSKTPMIGTNAETVAGLSPNMASSPNTIAQRSAFGSMDGILAVADPAALAALSMAGGEDQHLVEVSGLGIYRLHFGDATAADGANVLEIGGGRAKRVAILYAEDGTLGAAAPTGVGTPAAEGKVAVYNANGLLPLEGVPSAPIFTPVTMDAGFGATPGVANPALILVYDQSRQMVLGGKLYLPVATTTAGYGWRYDIATNTWDTNGPIGVTSWTAHAWVTHAGKVYAMCRSTATSTNFRMYAASPGGAYVQVGALTAANGNYWAMVSDGNETLYLVQMSNSGSILFYAFNTTTNTFTQLTNFSWGINQIAEMWVDNGYVYVLFDMYNGTNGHGEQMIARYSIAGNTWGFGGWATDRILSSVAFKVENLMFLVGGYVNTDTSANVGQQIGTKPTPDLIRAVKLDSPNWATQGLRITKGILPPMAGFQGFLASNTAATGTDETRRCLAVACYIAEHINVIMTWKIGWTEPVVAATNLLASSGTPHTVAVNYATGAIGQTVAVAAGQKYGLVGYDANTHLITQEAG
jgi:hypothetical protein